MLPVSRNRGCPRPKGYWALVNHMRAEPYHQITGYFINLDTLQDLSFTRWQPVLSAWRCFTDSKNILEVLQRLQVAAVVPSKFFVRFY